MQVGSPADSPWNFAPAHSTYPRRHRRPSSQIAAERLRSGIDLYDREFHRRIEVGKFRTIKGQLRKVRAVSPGCYQLRGALSLHGVTRELEAEVTVRVRVGGGSLEIEGSNTIDMREFDLDPPRILMLEVQPQLSVRFRIYAVRTD